VTVLSVNLLEHGLDLIRISYIDLVNRDTKLVLGIFGAKINNQRIERLQALGVGQGQMDSPLRELVSACASNTSCKRVALAIFCHCSFKPCFDCMVQRLS
jgi:hypothetical protein